MAGKMVFVSFDYDREEATEFVLAGQAKLPAKVLISGRR